MKIVNNLSIQKSLKMYSNQVRTKETKSASKLSKKDELMLSEEGKDVQLALKAAAKSEGYRAEKVRELKERIQSGNYELNMEKVAQKMIDDANIYD